MSNVLLGTKNSFMIRDVHGTSSPLVLHIGVSIVQKINLHHVSHVRECMTSKFLAI